MTQKQFDNRCARIIRSFERYAKRVGMDEARAKWRDEDQLIYVKRHTVEAYFRRRKPRRRSTTATVAASLGRELH